MTTRFFCAPQLRLYGSNLLPMASLTNNSFARHMWLSTKQTKGNLPVGEFSHSWSKRKQSTTVVAWSDSADWPRATLPISWDVKAHDCSISLFPGVAELTLTHHQKSAEYQ